MSAFFARLWALAWQPVPPENPPPSYRSEPASHADILAVWRDAEHAHMAVAIDEPPPRLRVEHLISAPLHDRKGALKPETELRSELAAKLRDAHRREEPNWDHLPSAGDRLALHEEL